MRQHGEYSSNCRGATAACAVSTAVGAARDLKYDPARGALVLDRWAPVRMSQATAECVGYLHTILRICLLQFATRPSNATEDPFIRGFADVLAMVCDPAASSGQTQLNS